VDRATFDLPVQGGTTAIAPLPENRFQVLWTQGDATQGLNAKSTNVIKIKYLILDSNLNQIGSIKTLPPALASHAGFNYLTANAANSFSTAAGRPNVVSTKISFKAGPNLVLKNRNAVTGLLSGPNDILFPVPEITVLVDIDFGPTSFGEPNYGGIQFENGRYFFVCGNANNPVPTAKAAFPADILNGTILPIPNSDDFNFVVLKRLNNPERVGIDLFQIRSENCMPIRSRILTPPARQNLGQLPFFGGIASTPSLISPNGGHLAVIRSEADGGVDVFMRHLNTLQGTPDSQFSDLDADEEEPDDDDPVDDPAHLFLYALFVHPAQSLN
jgi:hypothetical protein